MLSYDQGEAPVINRETRLQRWAKLIVSRGMGIAFSFIVIVMLAVAIGLETSVGRGFHAVIFALGAVVLSSSLALNTVLPRTRPNYITGAVGVVVSAAVLVSCLAFLAGWFAKNVETLSMGLAFFISLFMFFVSLAWTIANLMPPNANKPQENAVQDSNQNHFLAIGDEAQPTNNKTNSQLYPKTTMFLNFIVALLWIAFAIVMVIFALESVSSVADFYKFTPPDKELVPIGGAPTKSPTILTNSPTFTVTLAPTYTPTTSPTLAPTFRPTVSPTFAPTSSPTVKPSQSPSFTYAPSVSPTASPSHFPTVSPSAVPTLKPSASPTLNPSSSPTKHPSAAPTVSPSNSPSASPTVSPTPSPTNKPTLTPSNSPSASPTVLPTSSPTKKPTDSPTKKPSDSPSATPTLKPSSSPTTAPTNPTSSPSNNPTGKPTEGPTTANPTATPTLSPTTGPTSPTSSPTKKPTANPSLTPTTANPTFTPTTANPTLKPTVVPTTLTPSSNPTTQSPTLKPTTKSPTGAPTTQAPTLRPTTSTPTRTPTTSRPTTPNPTVKPTTATPTVKPTTARPTTGTPTLRPTTGTPTLRPTTKSPTPPTQSPTTIVEDESKVPHKIQIKCGGPENASPPYILFDATIGGTHIDWTWIQRSLATSGYRSCAYSRSGIAYSQEGLHPRSAKVMASELNDLISYLGFDKYNNGLILVAQGTGSHTARVYRSLYGKNAVKGFVFINGIHKDDVSYCDANTNPIYDSSILINAFTCSLGWNRVQTWFGGSLFITNPYISSLPTDVQDQATYAYSACNWYTTVAEEDAYKYASCGQAELYETETTLNIPITQIMSDHTFNDYGQWVLKDNTNAQKLINKSTKGRKVTLANSDEASAIMVESTAATITSEIVTMITSN